MLKEKWQSPGMSVVPMDLEKLGNVNDLTDAALKIKLEQAGYKFQKTYRASENYIHRKIADSDVLISVGSNIANFNGYIEMNESAAVLWEKLQTPCRLSDLENVLEETFNLNHETAVQDVLDFMKLLGEHDMVVVQ